MSEQRAWEIAVAGVAFPVAVLTDGVDELGRVCGWGGETEAPRSLSIRYEAAGIQVTTYPYRWWGDDSFDVFDDLVAWVENDYSSAWRAHQPGTLDFEGLEVAETIWVKTEKGYLEARMYEPQEVIEEERRERQQVGKGVEHRVVSLPLGDSVVDVTVVGEREIWSGGFETDWEEGPLSILVGGGSVPIDGLRLELVNDLPRRFGTALDDWRGP